jgi:hypothetical protein
MEVFRRFAAAGFRRFDMNSQRNLSLLVGIVLAGILLALAACQVQEPNPNSKFMVPFVGKQAEALPADAYPVPEPSQTVTPRPPALTFTPFQPALTLTPGKTSRPTDEPWPTNFFPTLAIAPTSTPYVRPAGARGQTLPASKWQEWPIVPVVSDHARALYKAALAAGSDPKRFSKIGDCQVIRQYFLGLFDDKLPTNSYKLGDKYQYLQRTLDQFAGSWTRVSEAVRSGFNVASVTTPLYSNPKNCKTSETPMQCEMRIWHPSIVIISMETWTEGRPTAAYESYLREIVDFVIADHALPILATKADNKEGDNSINAAIARVAADYDVPLWNFWRAAQPLTDHGLTSDGFHLTNGPNYFDNKTSMDLGWPVRNLTALQALDAVWQAVKK